MSDISRERRARWIEHRLAERPTFTAAERRFLSIPLVERGWELLLTERSQRGDVAAFAVGPSGVYAMVFTDRVPDSATINRIRGHAEHAVAGLLFGRSQFVPHMLEVTLLMPTAAPTEAHDRWLTADERTLRALLLGRERVLSPQRVREIATAIDARHTEYRLLSQDSAPIAETPVTDGLFEPGALRADARTVATGRPFRDWMIFLDPDQLAAANTNFNGPARYSGPAGTGKSVVALHRMARFAKRNPGRLLFTSFVRTLPGYHRSAFEHLAPQVGERAEFVGLHSWVTHFLNSRGIEFRLDDGGVDDAYGRAWMNARDQLGNVEGTDNYYWRDELDRVIKGRGLASVEEYKRIARTGREGVSLRARQREYVWSNLYGPYRDRLRQKNIDDFNDIVGKAIEELRARPLDDSEDYAMVVVDEVQDFTLQELRLVYEIAGGTPNSQLLLVGDGQQQVYAGGWRLSEAGIGLAGRGRVLRTNYRNRAAILRFAQRIEAANTVDDLDGGRGFVLRDSDSVLPGGTVIEEFLHRDEVDDALARAVTECEYPLSDLAVIVNTRKEATHYREVLAHAGIEVLPLERYNGTPTEAIKVGTVHRAKGMDFAGVFHITPKPANRLSELSGAERDKAEQSARQTLVALSRPRDYVWVAFVEES